MRQTNFEKVKGIINDYFLRQKNKKWWYQNSKEDYVYCRNVEMAYYMLDKTDQKYFGNEFLCYKGSNIDKYAFINEENICAHFLRNFYDIR